MNNGKLSRWVLRIKELTNITYFFVHCKGRSHAIPDCLSRDVFVPMVKTDTIDKVDLKKPVIVSSPFKSGELVDLEQVETLIKQCPNLVYQFDDGITDVAKFEKLNALLLETTNVKTLLPWLTKMEMKKAQRFDEFCQKIRIKLLENEEARKPLCSIECKEHHSHTYYYDCMGLLYRRQELGRDPGLEGRLVVPKSRFLALVSCYHVDDHSGSHTLFENLRESYYIPYMSSEILKFISQCHYCAIFKTGKAETKLAERPYLPNVERSFYWHLDEILSFPKHQHCDAVLSIIEEVSNFRLAIPLRNRSAKAIAKILEERLISVLGPKCLVSDKATNLVLSKEVTRVLEKYGVAFHTGSAYASRSRGKIEASNKTISTLIRIMADKLNCPWPEVVPFVTCLLNNQTTPHLGGFSPQFILMGLHPALNQRFQKANRGLEDLSDISGKWHKHAKFFQEQYEKINEKFNKIYAARGGVEHDFKEGEFVYMKDFRLTSESKKRLRPTYFRSPLVIRRSLDATIVTEDLDGSGIIRLIHCKNAKRATPFSVQQYQLLPPQIRIQLGHAFTPDELKDILQREGLTKMPRLFSLKPNEKFPWTSKKNIDPNIDLPPTDDSARKAAVTLDDPLGDFPFDGLGSSVFLDEDPDISDLSKAMLEMQSNEQMSIADGPPEVDISVPDEIIDLPPPETVEKHVTFDFD